jgi:hypothetical protein
LLLVHVAPSYLTSFVLSSTDILLTFTEKCKSNLEKNFMEEKKKKRGQAQPERSNDYQVWLR